MSMLMAECPQLVTASEMDLYEEDLKTQLDGFCIDSVNVNVG